MNMEKIPLSKLVLGPWALEIINKKTQRVHSGRIPDHCDRPKMKESFDDV